MGEQNFTQDEKGKFIITVIQRGASFYGRRKTSLVTVV